MNSYTLDITGNTMNKILKLSTKTLNSTIKINNKDDLVLSKDSPYYKLENGFKGQLILEECFYWITFKHRRAWYYWRIIY